MLVNTVELQRMTAVKDASGGNDPTWATITSNIACSIQRTGTQTKLAWMQTQERFTVSHNVFFMDDVGAVPGDRLVDDETSLFLLVHGYQEDSVGRDLVYKAECEQVSGGD